MNQPPGSRTPGALLLMTAVMLAASIAAVSGRTQASQTSKPQTTSPEVAMSEDELAKIGEPLVTKVCATECHGVEKLEEMRRSRADWTTQVGLMVTQGAVATPPQLAIIRKYLTRYYGFVAVNTAAVDEISAVMGFTAKDAEAIVAYRTAIGKFADVDALRKVPGIDLAKIDEQPEALKFK